jgi:hypothetical protein
MSDHHEHPTDMTGVEAPGTATLVKLGIAIIQRSAPSGIALVKSWLKGKEILIGRLLAQADLAIDLAKYSLLHLEYMGLHMPMPATPPSAFQREFGKQNFLEFLEYHNLLSLVGVLQYGYEVQGYGVLRQIPAYYGLVWITPAITWTILMDSLSLEDNTRRHCVDSWLG